MVTATMVEVVKKLTNREECVQLAILSLAKSLKFLDSYKKVARTKTVKNCT